jgi:hypothetical protein
MVSNRVRRVILQGMARLTCIRTTVESRPIREARLKSGPERHNGVNPRDFARLISKIAAPLTRLCLLTLVVNVGVALGQKPASDHKPRESNIVRLDRARRIAYHTRFLREVARSSPLIEVVWDMEKVFPSLRYIADNGSEQDNDAVKAVGSIFSRTEDSLARDLCLSALKRIGSKAAKREMLRIL